VDQILKEYPRDVKLVWRHMSMSFHPQAELAAEAAQEAFVQKGNAGFWSYHDLLFANQSALERPDLEHYAQQIGLDLERFRRALDVRTHEARVDRDSGVGQSAALGGTPGFIINGYFVSGAQPFAAFDKLIKTRPEGRLTAARAARLLGVRSLGSRARHAVADDVRLVSWRPRASAS
jgi:protein-disulfide isomerase